MQTGAERLYNATIADGVMLSAAQHDLAPDPEGRILIDRKGQNDQGNFYVLPQPGTIVEVMTPDKGDIRPYWYYVDESNGFRDLINTEGEPWSPDNGSAWLPTVVTDRMQQIHEHNLATAAWHYEGEQTRIEPGEQTIDGMWRSGRPFGIDIEQPDMLFTTADQQKLNNTIAEEEAAAARQAAVIRAAEEIVAREARLIQEREAETARRARVAADAEAARREMAADVPQHRRYETLGERIRGAAAKIGNAVMRLGFRGRHTRHGETQAPIPTPASTRHAQPLEYYTEQGAPVPVSVPREREYANV